MTHPTFEDDPRPQPPAEPELGDCCGSGCAVCVFDRYDQLLERYRQRLADWMARHPEAGGGPTG